MPINTMLNFKTRFERKRISEKWFLFWYNVLPSARLDFCATDLFPGTFIDFRFSDVYRSLDERFNTHVDPCP